MRKKTTHLSNGQVNVLSEPDVVDYNEMTLAAVSQLIDAVCLQSIA